MARERFAFVLRLWIETDMTKPDLGRLRGSLEVVEPKQVYYINSIEQIPALLRTVTGWYDKADPASETGEEGDM